MLVHTWEGKICRPNICKWSTEQLMTLIWFPRLCDLQSGTMLHSWKTSTSSWGHWPTVIRRSSRVISLIEITTCLHEFSECKSTNFSPIFLNWKQKQIPYWLVIRDIFFSLLSLRKYQNKYYIILARKKFADSWLENSWKDVVSLTFDVKKLKSRQLAATDAEKIYHSVVNWSAWFFSVKSHDFTFLFYLSMTFQLKLLI